MMRSPRAKKMSRRICVVLMALSGAGLFAQAPDPVVAPTVSSSPSFEVATIKPTALDAKAGRYITMQGTNRFIAKYYTLKLMIAAAYDLSPKVISGGPTWIDSDHYDIVALTPGDTRPSRPQQMAMLRTLLADRF